MGAIQVTTKFANASWHGHTYVTTARKLMEAFGAPEGTWWWEKCHYHWELETEEGLLFTIYDYRRPRFGEDTEIDWHIGAKTADVAEAATEALEEYLSQLCCG